jgi:hypothetical protein
MNLAVRHWGIFGFFRKLFSRAPSKREIDQNSASHPDAKQMQLARRTVNGLMAACSQGRPRSATQV